MESMILVLSDPWTPQKWTAKSCISSEEEYNKSLILLFLQVILDQCTTIMMKDNSLAMGDGIN